MREELKPCPFCGDTYIQIYATNSHSRGHFAIGCNTVNCVGLHCESKLFKTKEEAINAWNRRPNDDLIVSPLLKGGTEMHEVIMRYDGAGEDSHNLTRVGELVRCKDCGSYNKHDKRCTFWNHGQHPGGWCNEGKRKEDA